MRDKQYIVNLVESLVGRSLIRGMISDKDSFKTAGDLVPILDCVIMPKLHEMTAEKLGIIIEYSDLSFLIENSTAIHRGKVFDTLDSSVMTCVGDGLSYGGHVLLVYLASMTVMSIAFDLVKQADYERERRRLELQDQQQHRYDVSVGLYDDNDGERR
jgi:hypothetical protein